MFLVDSLYGGNVLIERHSARLQAAAESVTLNNYCDWPNLHMRSNFAARAS